MEKNVTNAIVNDKSSLTDQKLYLCVIMPAYNEEAHIYENLLQTSAIISEFVKKYQIIVVNDGSSDNTLGKISEACDMDHHIGCLTHSANKGKGYSIKKGVMYAEAEYIAFLDSDLELSPTMLRYFLKALQATDADIAIGSKMHPQSKLDYPLSRRIMSTGYYMILKLLFHMSIHDTQTGIKLFKAPVIKSICQELDTNGYAFDIEILATATLEGCKIIELPVELEYKRDRKEKSRFTLKTINRIFLDTIRIKRNLNKKKKHKKGNV